MVIDAYSTIGVFYNIFYKIDLKKGEPLTLVMDKPEEIDGIFFDNDKVLDHYHQGANVSITAKEVGISKGRFMKDDPDPNKSPKVVREILFNVVDSIPLPATTLNAAFGNAVPKTE